MNIEGTWWNEFGSRMEIETDPADLKTFRGTYHTKIGRAQRKAHPLIGRCDNRELSTKTLGFVVAWNADPTAESDAPGPSVTAWCGHMQVVDGQEVIVATWILDRLKPPAEDWESTHVGTDYFSRVRPSAAEVELARKHGRGSRAL